MGFDLCIVWTTSFDWRTGKPFYTPPPEIPEAYRAALYQSGWGWEQFIHDCEGDRCPTYGFADTLPEWEDVEKKDDLDEEEYTEWKKAMEWFDGQENFCLTWG